LNKDRCHNAKEIINKKKVTRFLCEHLSVRRFERVRKMEVAAYHS